jgi:hypothetical protein
MAINQLTTANTFQEWLSATSELIAVANNLTNNTSGGFLANSSIFIEGNGSSLNVRNLANINTLQANSFNLTGNVATMNVTSNGYIGGDLFVYGNVTISGNVSLDEIGFDDLFVGGTANIVGNTTMSNTTINYGNLNTANVVYLVGSSNTAIYANIASAYSVGIGSGLYANAAFVHANSAYQSQNATGEYANAAFTVANGAFIHANSGFIQANAAFTIANNALDQTVAFSIALG